jgi:hypothetical protein
VSPKRTGPGKDLWRIQAAMSRLSPCAALVLAACATTAPSQKGETAAAPAVDRQKIVNISHFDVGSCTVPAPALPNPLNMEGIVGALVLARPGVLECFVDPKHRGTEAEASAAVKATVGENGPMYEVTGTNLTPAGVSCIETALKRLPFVALEKGTPSVTGSADFRHGATSPAVKFGVNAASDVAGSIRLAAPAWCDCWASLGTTPPPSLRATVKLHATTAGAATDISFDPTTHADATALISCLTPKLAALRLVHDTNELTLSYPFLLVNSSAAQESAEAQPELQFIQLDLIRAQRAAEVAVKIGARTNALQTYDALVAKYKLKPDPKRVTELKDKCAAMVQSDDDWIAALKSQGEVDARSSTLAKSLKAKDARWTEAEAAAQAQVTASQNDVKKAEDVRAADVAVCPKERR